MTLTLGSGLSSRLRSLFSRKESPLRVSKGRSQRRRDLRRFPRLGRTSKPVLRSCRQGRVRVLPGSWFLLCTQVEHPPGTSTDLSRTDSGPGHFFLVFLTGRFLRHPRPTPTGVTEFPEDVGDKRPDKEDGEE